MNYPIHNIEPEEYDIESIGTKDKFWYCDKNVDMLFKAAQSGNNSRLGEDWAEKIACELAELLKLPHAQYDLAICNNLRGVVSPKFLSNGEELKLGNELLRPFVGGNDSTNPNIQYIDDVYRIMCNEIVNPPHNAVLDENIKTANHFFIGYLMFDVLIANQDRHNENWACIVDGSQRRLAPTYDHGASLARNISDEERRNRLKSKDIGQQIVSFVKKAKSHFQDKQTDKRLKLLDTFTEYAQQEPCVMQAWLDRLNNIRDEQIQCIVYKVPPALMSEVAKEFTYKLILENKSNLLKFKEEL